MSAVLALHGTAAAQAEVDRWADARVDVGEGAIGEAATARGWVEEPPRMEPEDWALLVPRAVLFVPKLALAVVFWPIVGGLEVVERHHVVEHVEEVLYWNDDQTLGWYPVLSYRSGVGPTVGLDLFHHDLLGHDERMTASARWGGHFTQGYELAFEADRVRGSRVWLEARARFEANPGLLFAGIGEPQEDSPETRYRQERLLGLLRVGYTHGTPGELLKVGSTLIANRRELGPNDIGEPSVGDVYDTARIPGFEDGVTTLEVQANLEVDARVGGGLAQRGIQLELLGGRALPVREWSYWHYGGELTWSVELWAPRRMLRLRGAVESVHGPRERIPFSELPRLGGADRLRGYAEDRFRDRRMAMASIEYGYPIHHHVQGVIFVDAGTVASTYRGLFDDREDWRLGWGGGLLVGGDDDVILRLDVSYGEGLHLFVSTDIARAFDGRSEQL